ncbi:hypothetical protein Tco_0821367 [Tanacetum coccineum]|uniref:Uncharacterized protein n=1 Tax=Tanacetum coccineum TaxID=301880 RepID=A0ABQ5AGE0_9ASTR
MCIQFAKSSSLRKDRPLQPRRNQSVVRQPTAFKSERPRFSKQRVLASQVDVNNNLSKQSTPHYLPRKDESLSKTHHMIHLGSSRCDALSANSQSTSNISNPKPRINNQKSRNWPASKSSCVTTKTVPIAEHSRNSRSFSDSKHFVCSTCQKCVFNANHDSCVTKFLNEVNSRAKVPSYKTTTRYKPVEQTSVAKKPERQIPKRHKSSIKKTSVVHEKTMTPRSCLRWKPTGKIFKTVGLRWVPTGKIFTSSTTKVDSEPQNGSNEDITNQYECEQTLDVSAGTLNLSAAMTSVHNSSGLAPPRQMTSDHNLRTEFHDHSNELSSSKLVPKVVPPADKTATSRQELELLFHHHITMLRIHKDGDGDASFQLKSDSLPHAHAQSTKTFYKHQDSRIMKAQELKTKTSAQTLIYKIFLQRYQVYQGRLLASFQDDAKYEHVGQDTRSQGGKDDQDKRIKI